MSCWWAVNYENIDKPSEKIQIDLMEDDQSKKDKKGEMKYYKLEFQEAKLHHMVFETIMPRGKWQVSILASEFAPQS